MKKNSLYMSVFNEDPETRRNCSRLCVAIESDDLISLRRLLSLTPELVHMPYGGSEKQVPLVRAIYHGKLEYCEVLLQFGADINEVDDITGDSLAIIAARQSLTDILEFLVTQAAPLDYQNNEGMTALMECAANTDVEGAALLLSGGADPTMRRARTGFTALHLAVSECSANQETFDYRHLALIHLLINFTAQYSRESLDNESADRDTPLLTAIRCGNFTVAKWLLEYGASPNVCDRYKYSPMVLLLHCYHDFVKSKTKKEIEARKIEKVEEFEVVEADQLIAFLIEKGADLTLANNRGENALHLAIGNNLPDCAMKVSAKVKGIASVLSQLNMNGHSVLHMLARGPHDQKYTLQILEQLVDKSVPKSVIDVRAKDDTTALFNAMCNKKLDVVHFLIDKGADVKCVCNGETLLHAACKSRKIEAVQYALQQEIDVNAVNRDFQSATHLSAALCPQPVMLALLAAGGDVNLKTKPDGYSPFYLAVRHGHNDIVEAMLSRANLEQFTAYGETAMAEAARQGNLLVVSSLIAACGNRRTEDGKRLIDLYASRGKPPLVAAAERGHRQVVDVLLRNGANPNLVILDGHSALYAAIGHNQIAAVRMLFAWGADLTVVNRCGPRLCCFSYVDTHPHLEMSPFFMAAKHQNLNLAKLCSKFYQSPPWALLKDIRTVFTEALEDAEADARWSPLFITAFVEFINELLAQPPPTLQHQCRMKIRTLLGAPMPLRLAFLNVPIEIKEFLLMRRELSEGAADDPPLPNPPAPNQ